MIRIVARQTLKEGAGERFVEIARDLVAATRQEEGNISYNLHRNVNEPLVYAFIETWKDQEAVEKHLNSEHFLKYAPQLDELMAIGAQLEVFEVLI